MVPDPAADLEIAHAAGWLHWCRYLSLEPGDDQEDLAAALALFALVHRTRPDAVPDQVRIHFGRLASDDPDAVTARAATVLQEALRTGNLAALTTAIGLLRQAVTATPDDHPDRAVSLSNLGLALRARFERAGDLADASALPRVWPSRRGIAPAAGLFLLGRLLPFGLSPRAVPTPMH